MKIVAEGDHRTMTRERFEELVAKAVDDLPEEFRAELENVDVVVQN